MNKKMFEKSNKSLNILEKVEHLLLVLIIWYEWKIVTKATICEKAKKLHSDSVTNNQYK